jgi:hypothetical protein
MKILSTLIALTGFIQYASAQFTGKLVYEIVRTHKLTMTYYQDKGRARIEAVNMRMNNGVPDPSTAKYQNVLLFDLSKNTETHLQQQSKMAIMTQYTFQMMASSAILKDQEIKCQNKGQETVNGYQCTHLLLTTSMKGYTTTRDVWITKDLGAAPGIYVMGSYLYYTPGYELLTKLKEAGGDGVVVKVIIGEAGLTVTVNLVSVDKKTPASSLFQIPSDFTPVDNTNYTLPPKQKN